MKWALRRVIQGLAVALVTVVAALCVAHRVSDGPIGPISGGPLRAGPLVTDPNVDWSAELAKGRGIELELVATGESRRTGAFVYDGQLYVPADLGFLARRAPNAVLRAMGRGIAAVKHWHQDAQRDGRVVLRVAGKRYERRAVRVTDPELLAGLRAVTEEGANKFFPEPLLAVPGDPDAIWFFRIDPR